MRRETHGEEVCGPAERWLASAVHARQKKHARAATKRGANAVQTRQSALQSKTAGELKSELKTPPPHLIAKWAP